MKKLTILVVLIVLVVILVVGSFNRNQAVILVSTGADHRSNPSSSLKLLTFNIRHGTGLDGRLDLERIARIIRQSGANLVGLNEVDMRLSRSGFTNQVKELAAMLKMNYAFGPTVRKELGSYGNAILSNYPIESAANHILPGQNYTEKRGLLTARVLLSPERAVYLLTTHLSLDKKEREGQLEWIEAYIKGLDHPFILMGDFNSELDAGFAYEPLLTGIKSFPAEDAREEIDLYFSNLDLEIISGQAIKTIASDHLPVLIELLLSEEKISLSPLE